MREIASLLEALSRLVEDELTGKKLSAIPEDDLYALLPKLRGLHLRAGNREWMLTPSVEHDKWRITWFKGGEATGHWTGNSDDVVMQLLDSPYVGDMVIVGESADRLEDLSEASEGVFRLLKRELPHWPDYVIRDLLLTKIPDQAELKYKLDYIRKFDIKNWTKKKVKVTLGVFDVDTQRRLKERLAGSGSWNAIIPRDVERHATQQLLLKKRGGPSNEPIIVFAGPGGKYGGKYELVEGWHRTIQALQTWPEGYDQWAWIGERGSKHDSD